MTDELQPTAVIRSRETCLSILTEAEQTLKPPVRIGDVVPSWNALIELVNAVPSLRHHLDKDTAP